MSKYSGIAVLLHWIVGGLIIVNVIWALNFDNFADESKRFAYDTHKSIGLTVFGFVVMRVLWRLTHKPPVQPAGFNQWEHRLSQIVHFALYFVMFALPVTGWLHDSAWKAAPEVPLQWFGLFEVARYAPFMALDPAAKDQMHHFFEECHEWSAWALYALVFLHLAGALKHQLIDKMPTLQRMWK